MEENLIEYTSSTMVPSSSGLGHLVLIQKIAGSTPAGITLSEFFWKGYFETLACTDIYQQHLLFHRNSWNL